MKIIGFNFKKVFAENKNEKISARPGTSIEFVDMKQDSADFLKDSQVLKFSFVYSVLYENKESKKKDAEVTINGEIIVSVTEEESNMISKEWKKKKLPGNINVILFNLILKKCTPKAIMLEDEIGLPIHTPMPVLQPSSKN